MKINIFSFLKEEKASLSVEAALIFSFLIILTFLIAHTSIALNTKSRLENLSYSLSSLLRQRKLFENEDLKKSDGNKIYNIALNLTKDFIAKDDLAMKIQALYFDNSSSKNEQKVKELKIYDFGEAKCTNTKSLRDFKHLSVFTNKSRWSSLYGVSLCVKVKNNFFAIENITSKIIPLEVNSITLGR